jgi:hypothetical protein
MARLERLATTELPRYPTLVFVAYAAGAFSEVNVLVLPITALLFHSIQLSSICNYFRLVRL